MLVLASLSLNIISHSDFGMKYDHDMFLTDSTWLTRVFWHLHHTYRLIHTYTLSYPAYSFSWRNLQLFKGTKEVRGESDALFEIIHTRWAHEGPGSSRFPFSQRWFLYMTVFNLLGFFLFLSSSVTAYFPFLGKDVQALCRVLLLSWKASEKLNKAAPCW